MMKESEIDPLLGKTGFYVKIRANFNAVEEMMYQFQQQAMIQATGGEGTSNKTKILIYEDSVFNKIAFENILNDQMKLKHQTKFFQNGLQIAETIRSLHMEREKNCVALVIIDYKMPRMNGLQLIRWTRDYFLNHAIPFSELPVFAFRAQQFYELPPDIIAELNGLGLKN
jgi:CheY-like chemotaxis protein